MAAAVSQVQEMRCLKPTLVGQMRLSSGPAKVTCARLRTDKRPASIHRET